MSLDIEPFIRVLDKGMTIEVIEEGRAIVRALASDASCVDASQHPLGFIHAKLGTVAGRDVRFHVWPEPDIPAQHPPWFVHRHAWPLESFVLYGSVINRTFAVREMVDGPHILYEVEYEEGVSVMRSTSRRVECEAVRSSAIDAGQRYEVSPADYHTTVRGGTGPGVTIALAGPSSTIPPIVVGAARGEAEYRFDRRRVDPELFAAVLRPLV